MKTALVTTTINVPTVLALYRKLDPSVKFFVAADEKTPLDAYSFCADIPDCEMYSPDRQKELGYECSPLLGWNNDSRRNIALLEALKWGAELIISIDDDMIPMNADYFATFKKLFFGRRQDFHDPGIFHSYTPAYSGLQLGTPLYWLDAGQLTVPIAKQRGLPLDHLAVASAGAAVGVNIGIAQGVILGVPDTDAATAATSQPMVHSASDILRNGFVAHPQARAVVNSQFTAFRRELAPAFAQFYEHQGRNTDILASLLMRRIAAERGLFTYFGPPFGFHNRRPRRILPDLRAEMYGLERIEAWADYLERAPLSSAASVAVQCHSLMRGFAGFDGDLKACADAFYSDVEKVL